MYICVDFDGTIVDHRYPEIGDPVPFAVDYLLSWVEAGAKLILFTMRSGTELDAAVSYLKQKGVQLHGVNKNPDQVTWSDSPKAFGHVYIDDAAFGCPMFISAKFARPCVDWSVVGPEVTRMVQRKLRSATGSSGENAR